MKYGLFGTSWKFRSTMTESPPVRMSACMFIVQNDHNSTIQVYCGLDVGQSSKGTFEPITPAINHIPPQKKQLSSNGESSWGGVAIEPYMHEIRDKSFRKFVSRHINLVHQFEIYVSHHVHVYWNVCSQTASYDYVPVIWVYREGYHMWGMKCSLSVGTADI